MTTTMYCQGTTWDHISTTNPPFVTIQGTPSTPYLADPLLGTTWNIDATISKDMPIARSNDPGPTAKNPSPERFPNLGRPLTPCSPVSNLRENVVSALPRLLDELRLQPHRDQGPRNRQKELPLLTNKNLPRNQLMTRSAWKRPTNDSSCPSENDSNYRALRLDHHPDTLDISFTCPQCLFEKQLSFHSLLSTDSVLFDFICPGGRM